jgi:hypothetical protein
MANKQDVWQGTLALMILKTLETLGPQHAQTISCSAIAWGGRCASPNC